MKQAKFQVQLTVTAPARMSMRRVAELVDKLIGCGFTDLEATQDDLPETSWDDDTRDASQLDVSKAKVTAKESLDKDPQ